ncbi:putative endonuclease [Peribacillus deserti]|uniref:Endonuclease n=1 Tax=Peribacillus deserti TaxID=673318 RepID=A0ABS2QPC6_9BACI|nr:GIY-YIG nuclease family protein [Peribacillus deserti]MBM7694795.1 putative endonuclease [Peribacillus deserti]
MEINNSHYFYVVECKDGSYYAGYTNKLKKRITAHNEGKGAKYTRGRGPVELIYSQMFSEKSEALKMEYRFKQLTRRDKERFIREGGNGYDVAAKKL